MSRPRKALLPISIALALGLSGCSSFQPEQYQNTMFGAGVGAATGALVGAATGGAIATSAVGAIVGASVGNYMDNKGKPELSEVARREIQIIQYGDTTTYVLPSDRFFAFNSSVLRPAEYRALDDLALFLKQSGSTHVTIEGYTDDIGPEWFNEKLSHDQAHSIEAYLWARGIDASILKAEPFGDRSPVARMTPIGREFNRRIEVVVHT